MEGAAAEWAERRVRRTVCHQDSAVGIGARLRAPYPEHPMVGRLSGRYAATMNPEIKKLILLLGAAALLAIANPGCNTTKGLGRDVEKLGDMIQEKASR